MKAETQYYPIDACRNFRENKPTNMLVAIYAVDFAVIENTGPGGYLLAWGNVCDATKEMSMNLKVHPK